MFFKRFGSVEYKLDGMTKKAANIITAAILKNLNVDRNYVFQKYIVKEGEHYDQLAEHFYKEPTWGWTLLLVNHIVDPFTEWAMDLQTLEEFTATKHGSIDKLLYFKYIDTGWILDDIADRDVRELIANEDPIPINVTPVTALQHETELNNQRRQITIISPRYIRRFVDEFYKAVESAS